MVNVPARHTVVTAAVAFGDRSISPDTVVWRELLCVAIPRWNGYVYFCSPLYTIRRNALDGALAFLPRLRHTIRALLSEAWLGPLDVWEKCAAIGCVKNRQAFS